MLTPFVRRKEPVINGEKRHQSAGSRPRWWLWGLAGGVVVVGGLAGGLIATASAAPNSSSTADASADGSASATSCPVAAIADNVLPSVVTISASGTGGAGTGSGEVIRSDGYILTNNHVIAIAANGGKVEVLFADGTSAPATIVGRDTLTDLAVLKVGGKDNLKPVTLGTSSSVQVGEPVIALGAPLGLSGSVTSGIVSALDRTVEVPAEDDKNALLVSAVQTDAAINPGNSGGALVNCSGELVGVPSAGATVPNESGESSGGSIGLGFAIPVDAAKTISDEIIATGRVTHAYFGLQTVPIPESAAAEAGVPAGLFVAGVPAGGPAQKAGIQAGDVITTIDGQPATSNVQLQELTLTKKPGDTVELGYARDGREATATVTLAEQP
ncbi:MAG TPA: trypsin-like peptidase domain-containing protein [Trebonia sp.]|nr:trypsin-like peptidase domain-containing protein [Trebonia sp.]